MNRNPMLRDKLNDDFYIFHRISESWAMPEYHYHEGFEIYFALSEGANIFVENKVYQTKVNDIFVFNHLELHRIDGHYINLERYVIMFNPEYVQFLSSSSTDLLECFMRRDTEFNHQLHLSKDQADKFNELLAKAQALDYADIYGREIYRKLALTEILLFLNDLYRKSEAYNTYVQKDYNERIEKVLKYINNHLNEELTVEHLANTFYLSKYHLQCLFKKATGFKLHEYIINRRIIKARELLKKQMSVSEAGERVGFFNTSHFIRAFKNIVGVSPKQYGKSFRGGTQQN